MGNNQISKIQEETKQKLLHKLHQQGKDLKFSEEELNTVKNKSALELQQAMLTDPNFHSLPTIFQMFHHIKQIDNNKHNALTEVLYKLPLERSQELQELRTQNKLLSSEYPLLGFIFSIKDSNILKNTSCTNGFIINKDKKYTKNPKSIKLLISKGALITCKGNIPQALFSMESNNNLFGKTKNPYNQERTSGGSSGGEAVLIRSGLVNCAIGSDVAGSLRIPALFCGIVAFKPTIPRISNDMTCQYFDLQDWAKGLKPRVGCINATIGPMAKTVSDCEAIMKVLIQSSEFDKDVPPLGWREVKIMKRVGVMVEIKQLPVSLPYKRGLKMVENALKKNGIDIVEIDLNDLFEDMIVTAMATFLKNEQLFDILNGSIHIKEHLVSAFDKIKKLAKMPTFLIKKILQLKKGQRVAYYLKAKIMRDEENINFINRRINVLYDKFLNIMKKNEVDVIISPGFVTPAVRLQSSKDNNMQGFYTFMFNMFNMPSGVLPVTKVEENEQVYEDGIEDEITKSFRDQLKDSKGLPIGIHVAGLPWKDEMVIELMKLIEKEIGFEA